MYARADTYTHANAYTHTYIHTHTYTHTRSDACAHEHTHTYTQIHAHAHAHAHAHIHTNTYIHTYIHTCTDTCMGANPHCWWQLGKRGGCSAYLGQFYKKVNKFVRQGETCPGATTQPKFTTTAYRVGVCTKCAMSKKSGELSCCARGGSWFGKCGNFRDIFEYHWDDGVDACKQMARAMNDHQTKTKSKSKRLGSGYDGNSSKVSIFVSKTKSESTFMAVNTNFQKESSDLLTLISILFVNAFTQFNIT